MEAIKKIFNELFCFHSYQLVASKNNFYGSVEIEQCKKCKKKKVKVCAYPELGLPSKSTYKHFELEEQ